MSQPQFDAVVDRLARRRSWRYASESFDSAEPLALAALALLSHGRTEEAYAPLARLTAFQASDGSVAFREGMADPEWCTSLAVLAWIASGEEGFAKHATAACQWIAAHPGKPVPRSIDIGHDSELPAWSWVQETSPWLEPTAFHVLALKAQGGYEKLPLLKSGVAAIYDRLLPSGGANCGNTIVFNAELRPHLQPSGIALLALAGEKRISPKVARTRDYLNRALLPTSATPSLCWGLLGLAAHDDPALDREALLTEHLALHDLDAASEHRLALIALAAAADAHPFHPSGRLSVTAPATR
ncbi:MAG TPA: hypothetical protein VGN57_19325 [Pirellulaceae bacterium]|jgi:hypothetical protein|nr:hypothetical protein [Pirellulaceae bacterium]